MSSLLNSLPRIFINNSIIIKCKTEEIADENQHILKSIIDKKLGELEGLPTYILFPFICTYLHSFTQRTFIKIKCIDNQTIHIYPDILLKFLKKHYEHYKDNHYLFSSSLILSESRSLCQFSFIEK